MQIAQLFFHNSILIASRTADFWCFLKELAGLHRILIGFCDLFRQILLIREKTARIIQKPAQKNRQHDSFACLLWYVRAVKGFFHVSFYDASESSHQPLQSKSECQRPTLSSSSCLPISCCPSSPSMPSPEIGQSLSGKTTAAAESSY